MVYWRDAAYTNTKFIWGNCRDAQTKDNIFKEHSWDNHTASAKLYYDDGIIGLNLVLTKLRILPIRFTNHVEIATDAARLKNMQRKSQKDVKKWRKKLRTIRKGFQDTETKTEGIGYESGTH